MKKRIIAMSLVLAMMAAVVVGCTDSSKNTVIQEVDYDPTVEVAKYELGELSAGDKDFVIQLGYRDCDHMVPSIIGEKAGIYEALGLNVVVTKTGKIMEAMSSGEMHVGYQGIEGAIKSVNQGAPLFMAAANHLGGSRYLVVSNDIKEPKDLIGKTLAIGSGAETRPEWRNWAEELDIPVGLENYEVVDMGDKDKVFALKAGQLDAFSACDPYGSMVEFEGFGRIMATGWGAHVSDNMDEGWGICCIYCMNNDFLNDHPELAKRLVLAHALSIKYLYEHPYNASMMFAEGFGTAPEVGLKTVYMKTVAEGRTITWKFSEENLDNYIQYFYDFEIPEEEIPNINDIQKFMSTDLLETCGIEDFNTFIKENIDTNFPIGDTYEEWLVKAKAVDGIEESTASNN
ncbi:ABC transporter substrate-binding subunit SaoX [Tissierella sp. MB52-C2]|uniref:ABC transporter substrate-binding subunit SaoX n=1 Tax=Tissierella sp. MB52-C2 TaxID=3070999 RepID=UPI00280B459B|nr:ABC transporter substrate-binding subunit SaoX [Tissierella sp. MB52-C2]WMM24419.1 ABC transporter substrate-binding subunit SaoX [Tissierella sp. MB52-C2]